ncbi:MazG nucleotide pyrophosphohydrolase domain-containing protein [Catellatospora tritici]|uniref:MazG nucleotide pyrophosphohydrolase domain-containing protein n=1 Tax=Catellatospora tritici TaxID=2851566 RepID=UPI0027E0AF6C|nr:MazG nucleotide pyrophosphohydrolase domain-containing protein [Catellatospora tritici]
MKEVIVENGFDGPSPAAAVWEFHRTFGLPRHVMPTPPSPELAQHRLDLIREEAEEVDEAIASGDLVHTAWEMADLVYVLYGTAASFGIDLDAVVAEVHRANMSKLDEHGRPVYRADGKVLKGPDYQAPDVAAVLRRQAGRATEATR